MEIREDELRALASDLVSFESYPGEEAAVQAWLWERLGALGFERYRWEPDPGVLRAHPSFPPVETLDLADRPSVAGVLAFGDPDAGPTIVLNGHADVVPVEASAWSADPFDPAWRDGQLYGLGSADMKGGLWACVTARAWLGTVARAHDDLAVATINPRTDPPLIDRFGITSVPTLLRFEDGAVVGRLADGFQGGDAIDAFLAETDVGVGNE